MHSCCLFPFVLLFSSTADLIGRSFSERSTSCLCPSLCPAISPADVHYGETLSTLRYANQAKNIVDCGLVDEDSGVKVIRELQEEIGRLRGLIENNNQVGVLISERSLV